MNGRWVPVADGVFARRYADLDQTLGLVVGQRRCLVVDSGADEEHGAEFAAAVRAITPLPWTLVITHAHFDHVFGTAAFLPCPVLAHERCRAPLVDGEADRRTWVRRLTAEGTRARARRLARARVVEPSVLFTDRVSLDLGGRRVDLVHPGPAHTDHDVVVHVPDVGVVFAGDLVEQGADPQVGPDAHRDHWPAALAVVLAMAPTVVVPGHGDPVDAAFVRAQRDWLAG